MNYQNLTTNQRLNRIFIGSVLIVSTMLIGLVPLGWFAVLPLLATYPIFAGIYGYDPVSDIAKHGVHAASHAITHIHTLGHRSKHV